MELRHSEERRGKMSKAIKARKEIDGGKRVRGLTTHGSHGRTM
jgi:hypothetical protein